MIFSHIQSVGIPDAGPLRPRAIQVIKSLAAVLVPRGIGLTEALARDVLAVPVRKTSSWAAPAAVQVAPHRTWRATATGQGHWASGPIYSLWSLSRESVQSRIGFTESLARAGPASHWSQ